MIKKIYNSFIDFLKVLYYFLEKNKYTFCIFAIIFILYYFLCDVITMYFDDYGNASLSYAYNVPNVSGTNYTIAQLLEWAGQIYNHYGGRILYAIAFIIPLLKHGIGNYMLVQSFVLTGIIFFMYKIIKTYSLKSKYIGFVPIILFVLYNLIDMVYLRHGIYWASASILYVWPLLPFFILIYLYINICYKIKNNDKINYIITVISIVLLSFLTTFSQEQIGIGVLLFQIAFIIFHHLKDIKKYLKIDIPFILTTLISYLVLFLAPGNWQRLGTQNAKFAKMNIIEKLSYNYPNFIKLIFLDKFHIFIYILCIIIFYMIYKCYKHYKSKYNKKSYLFLLGIIPNILIILQIHFYSENNFHQTLFLLLGTLWLAILFTISVFYFCIDNRNDFCALLVGGFGTIACLLMSPVLGGRTYIPFIYFAILLICKLLLDILNDKNIFKFIFIILFAFLCKGAILNYHTIYEGYRDNYSIYKLNNNILLNYKDSLKNNTIKLYKVENSWYGSTQSYEEPSMDFWIKEFYNIPQDVKFEWSDIYEDFR